MTEITESKKVYEEFKYFKNLYVTLNKSSFIIFSKNEENNISMDFINDPADIFYILRGKLTGNTLFLNWIRENSIICKFKLEDMKKLKETLKKNVVSVSWNSESFTFKTIDGELVIENNPDLQNYLIKPIRIESYLIEKEAINSNLLNDDIVELFEGEDNSITGQRTNKKIIEIPSKKILSLLKDPDEILLHRGTNNERMFVAIESTSQELGISLRQIFATI